MTFDDFKLKNIDNTVRFVPSLMKFSAKQRPNHIIGLQLKGSARHIFNDRRFILAEGQIYFFNQREDYDVEIIERGLAFSIHFTTYGEIETESFAYRINNTAEVLRLLERIEKQNPTVNKGHAVTSDFYALCTLFSEIRQKNYRPYDRRADGMREYINRNFRDSDVLSGAARESGITRRRFNDIFKEAFDVTPGRYLTGVKTNYAKKLLLSKELSVTDIAELCGFSDIYYFSRIFRNETGMTPTEYRSASNDAKGQ